MDFEFLHDEQPVTKPTDCNCTQHICVTVLMLTIVNLLINCVYKCQESQKVRHLKRENETLKSMILKSVDNAFMRIMKNGNDTDDEHDE